MARRFTLPITEVQNSSGGVGGGWKLEFFETGTSTPLDNYSDNALATANDNPIIANSGGRFADIFLKDQDYKITLSDNLDVQQWSADPVHGGRAIVVPQALGDDQVTATGSTTARSLAKRFSEVYNVLDYGALTDGTDASTSIQAAIDAAETAGGGTVFLPAGIYSIETGLIVDNDNVLLVGEGASGLISGGKAGIRAAAATTLKWTGSTGSGTMLKFTSDAADGGTELTKSGGGAIDIFIDGQEKALICFELQSWAGALFRLHCAWAQTFGFKIWTLVNGVSSGTVGNQHNHFDKCHYTEVNTGQNPVGMILGRGGTGGNTSMNIFTNLRINLDGTGNGLELENTDTNTFYFTRVGNRIGGGTAKVIFHADDTGQLQTSSYCRFNLFFGVEFGDGLTVKQTIATTNSSINNIIVGYSRGNSAPGPTIEEGADLQNWQIGPGSGLTATLLAARLFDSGAGSGPTLLLDRDSASPADLDVLGITKYQGRNDAGQVVDYATIVATAVDVADGTEDGRLAIQTIVDGTVTSIMRFQNGVTIGSPDGSFKGVGTMNVDVDIFKDNTAYANPDYVLEHAATGSINRFAGNTGASDYTGLMSLDKLAVYIQEHYRLPRINDEPMGMFERGDTALEKIEELTLYVLDLHKRLKRGGL